MLAALSKPFISELGTDPGCSRAGNDIGRQMTTQQQWEANAVSYTCTLLSAFILADGAERQSNNGGISGFWTPAASRGGAFLGETAKHTYVHQPRVCERLPILDEQVRGHLRVMGWVWQVL